MVWAGAGGAAGGGAGVLPLLATDSAGDGCTDDPPDEYDAIPTVTPLKLFGVRRFDMRALRAAAPRKLTKTRLILLTDFNSLNFS